MIPINNIRRRVIFAAFALSSVVAAVFGSGLYLAFDAAEDKLFDDHLADDVEAFMQAYANDPGVAELSRRNFMVFIAAPGDIAELPAYLHKIAPNEDEVILDGKEFELQMRDAGGKRFYFLFDESEFEEFENGMLVAMLTIIFVVIAGSTWAGYLLAGRIIRPLTMLSAQVGDLGLEGTEAVALTTGPAADLEIEHLAQAIMAYHGRISELLRREHEFSADVSHELRTPLMAIQGAAELLERQDLNEASGELLKRIKRSCFHMTTLTEALLYLARDPEIFVDMVEPVSVKRVIDGQIAAVHDVAERKGIRVHVEQRAESTIDTIPAVIEIVLGNILKNAVKYTNKDVINIFIDAKEIVIQDYGPGIDRSVQNTLFDRFTRGQNRNPDGSGIGLALVRRFCEQYGWGIHFQSHQDTGTRVAVVF